MAERIPVFWDFNNAQLLRAQRELDKTRAKTRQLQGSANRLSTAFKNIGATLLASFGAFAVLAAFRNIINRLKELEFQMSKVAAISGATSEQMVKLRNNAIQVGAASKFTATEVGKLQEELARLGFTTTEILKLTDSISALAIVADTQLGPTALAVAKTINAFSLTADEGARVTNIMAESFTKTALDLEKFEAAIRNVGPAAKVAGLSLEETTAILGTLVDNGIEASKAGTDLRRILLNINKDGLTLNEALEKVQLSTDKLGIGFDLFGARAVVAGVIMAENTEKVRLLTEEFEDGNREIDEMRRIIEDNLETDLKKLASAFDALIQRGAPLNSVLRDIVNTTKDWINVLSGADPTILDLQLRMIELNSEIRELELSDKLDPLGARKGRLRDLKQQLADVKAELNFAEILKEKETTRRLEVIGDAVAAAFNAEDIEKFIDSLEETEEREEIIANIRRIQKLESEEEQRTEAEIIEKRKKDFEEWKKEQETRVMTLDELAESILNLNETDEEFAKEALIRTQENNDEIVEEFELTAAELKAIRDRDKEDQAAALDFQRKITMDQIETINSVVQAFKVASSENAKTQIALLAFEKIIAIARVIIFGAQERALLGKQLGLAAIPFQIRSKIRTIADVAAIIATAIPQLGAFKEGVIDYQGEGTTTSDSNLVRISKGESVINASATAKHKKLLESINDERINPDLSNLMVKGNGAMNDENIVDALINVNSSIKKLPIHQTFFNEKGVANYIVTENARIRKLRSNWING